MSSALAETLARLEIERKAETLKNVWPQLPLWSVLYQTRKASRGLEYPQGHDDHSEKANLPLHFTPHCLRQTYASLMLQQGESLVYVQEQLGHASIQITVDTYGKWLPMGNKAAVDRLDAVAAEQNGSSW